jgi:hypothetical protein
MRLFIRHRPWPHGKKPAAACKGKVGEEGQMSKANAAQNSSAPSWQAEYFQCANRGGVPVLKTKLLEDVRRHSTEFHLS